MIARRLILVALVAATLAAISAVATGPDVERGRGLYESQCYECHSPAAHMRPSHVAGDFGEIRRWVRQWNTTLGLEWNDEDVTDVAVFLNTFYYRYPCPADICPVVGVNR